MIVGFKTLSLRSKRHASTHNYTFAHVHTKTPETTSEL